MKLTMPGKKKVVKYSFDPMYDGVTQSVLSAWLGCRERARMGTILGLSSNGAAWPLVYGSVAHNALELYYGALSTGKTLDFNFFATKANASYVASAEARNNLERQQMAEEAGCIVAVILPHYHRKWQKFDSSVRWTVIEKQFRRPAANGRCIATGKIDGGFENKDHWLFETKNKSSFSASYDRWLGIDLQLGYYLLGYEALTKCRPVGALYNMLRRPDRLKAKSVSFKDYLARIEEDVAKRPDHYFQRYRQPFSNKDVDRHVASIEAKLVEFMNWHDAVDHSERDLMHNPGACEQFGSTCQYLDSCANGDRSGLVQKTAAHPELN